jgi:hypothetical protein
MLDIEVASVLPSVESASNNVDANPFCVRMGTMLLTKSNKARSEPRADL